jgi:Xaa-Pro aminopeptidase
MSRFATRRNKLRKLIKKAGADGLLVTDFVNVTYLTGFTGDDSYLIVLPTTEILLSDPRYTTQLETECPGLNLEIREPGVGMLESVASILKKAKASNLGIEAASMTVSLHAALAEKLPQTTLVNTKDLVEELRLIKDKEEVDAIRRAAWQAKRGFQALRATLRPEQTELEVAAALEFQMRQMGAKGCSFPSIIAVGAQAALPHARPGNQRIGENPLLLVDWGANEGLYMSDLTRIIVTGKMPPKLEDVYGLVLKAQLAGIAAIRPGVTCHQVDEVARSIIAKAGYDKHFGHGLGHGIGLQIHEAPRLARNQKLELRPGMVVTVEPGIYLPGWGGVRIEDDILVTAKGHEVLTDVPKELEDCLLD